ncbi:MAG: ABC transporter ATP-binding protein [Lysobacter sp.]
MNSSVIEASRVARYFGDIRAVDGVDLAVEKGEIFGLIGHNGAGKSTLFKMMLGLIPVSAGEIRINGHQVVGEAFRQVRRTIGYLPENVAFYDNLTGLETLCFYARLKRADQKNCVALLEKVDLAHAADRRVRGYSKGMRQRLGLAQALLGRPAILFLDEPTTGLDPEGIRAFYGILREMKAQGATVVITSHILAEIQERVDRLAIMKSGKIQALGTVQSLREAMDLPLWFHVSLREGEGTVATLRAALAGTGADEVRMEAGRMEVRCPRQNKMAVLSALSSMAQVDDIQVREPSLEDVFLGYPG